MAFPSQQDKIAEAKALAKIVTFSLPAKQQVLHPADSRNA
jgi:hypothetical protein